jgi:heptosyltransferase-1
VIVRLSARGDVVFGLPLVRAMRHSWPDTRITWVVEKPSADLVEHDPDLDAVIVWDRREWKRLLRGGRLISLLREVRRLRRRLRETEAELAVDLQGLLRSSWVARLTGAPIRVAVEPKEGAGALVTHAVPGGRDIDHMGGESRDVAEWLGLETEPWRHELTLPPADLEGAASALAAAGVESGYIVVVPHTTRDYKHWREDRWAPLVDALHRRTGWKVVVVGGPGDREATDRIARDVAPGVLVDLVGRTSLGEAAAVVAGSELVVGVDTGLTHVAHCFDRRTVCLFGPSAYVVPPTPKARIVRHDELECVRCMPRGGRPTCGGEWWCMDRIREAEIMSHVDDLLEGRPDPHPPARS